ncbi:hypothetical protein P9112_002938 [Eukaryota sp. TZLM1-RC]
MSECYIYIYRCTIFLSDDQSVPSCPLYQWFPNGSIQKNMLQKISSVCSHMTSLVQDKYVIEPIEDTSLPSLSPSITAFTNTWISENNLVEFSFNLNRIFFLPLDSLRSLYLCISTPTSYSRFSVLHILPSLLNSCCFFLTPSTLPPPPEIPPSKDLFASTSAERLQNNYNDELSTVIAARFHHTFAYSQSVASALAGKAWLTVPYYKYSNQNSVDQSIDYNAFVGASKLTRLSATLMAKFASSLSQCNHSCVGCTLFSGSRLVSTTMESSIANLSGLAINSLEFNSFSFVCNLTCNNKSFAVHKVIRQVQLNSMLVDKLALSGLYPDSSFVINNLPPLSDDLSCPRLGLLIGLLVIEEDTLNSCSLSVMVSPNFHSNANKTLKILRSLIGPEFCLFCEPFTVDRSIKNDESCFAVYDDVIQSSISNPSCSSWGLIQDSLNSRIDGNFSRVTISRRILNQTSVCSQPVDGLSSTSIIDLEDSSLEALNNLVGSN